MDTEKKQVYAFTGTGPTAAKLIDLLGLDKWNTGDIITDEALSAHCGKDTTVKGNGYSALQTAIRRVLRDKGLRWKRMRGEGCIKLLASAERLNEVRIRNDHIRHTAREAMYVANSIVLDDLEGQDIKEALALKAQVGTAYLVAKKDTTKKLVAREITAAITPAQLLAGFQSLKE